MDRRKQPDGFHPTTGSSNSKSSTPRPRYSSNTSSRHLNAAQSPPSSAHRVSPAGSCNPPPSPYSPAIATTGFSSTASRNSISSSWMVAQRENVTPNPQYTPSTPEVSSVSETKTRSLGPNDFQDMSSEDFRSLFGHTKCDSSRVSAGLATLSLNSLRGSPNRRHPYRVKMESGRTSSVELNKEIERYTNRRYYRGYDSREDSRRSHNRVNPYILERPSAPVARALLRGCCPPSTLRPIQPELYLVEEDDDQELACLHSAASRFVDIDSAENQFPARRSATNQHHLIQASPPRIACQRPTTSTTTLLASLPPARPSPLGQACAPLILPSTLTVKERLAPDGAEPNYAAFREMPRIPTDRLKMEKRPITLVTTSAFHDPASKFTLRPSDRSAFQPICGPRTSFVAAPSILVGHHLTMEE